MYGGLIKHTDSHGLPLLFSFQSPFQLIIAVASILESRQLEGRRGWRLFFKVSLEIYLERANHIIVALNTLNQFMISIYCGIWGGFMKIISNSYFPVMASGRGGKLLQSNQERKWMHQTMRQALLKLNLVLTVLSKEHCPSVCFTQRNSWQKTPQRKKHRKRQAQESIVAVQRTSGSPVPMGFVCVP